MKSLKDLGYFVGGGTPDTAIDKFWAGKIPWISSSDISINNIHNIQKTRFITENAITSSATKLIPKGAILMVSRVGIGKFAVADEELCTSQDFTNLITTENEYFLCYYFNNRSNDFISLSQGTSIKGFTTQDIKIAKFFIPSIKEQGKISSFLNLIDERIATQNKIIGQLETLIKGICQNLANNKHWEKQYLRNILTERKETNKDNLPIFSVSVSKGIINQIEYLGRSFASKNTTNYNVVYFGDIVYTKSPTGEFPYGIIKQSFIRENVAVSPLYGVYMPKNINIGSILHYYFNSPINANNYLHSLVQKGAKNTINITNQRFMDNAIYLPTDEKEIVKIASLLNAINKKNQTEKAVLTQFENQKKYLLKQMFV